MSNLNNNNNNSMGRSQSYNHLSTSTVSSPMSLTTPNTPTSATLDVNKRSQLGSSNNPLSNSGSFDVNTNMSSSTPIFNQHSVPNTPTINSQVDETSLKRLIKSGHWNQVFKVADFCISNTNNPLSILQYKLCRVISHVKLRNYKIAFDEIQGIGDIRDLVNCFETYHHLFPNRKGTMVPFSMRIIKAELSAHLNAEKYQLDSLYGLLSICKREIHILEKLLANTTGSNTPTNNNATNNNINSVITEEILLSQVESTTSVLLNSTSSSTSSANPPITPTNILSPNIIVNTNVEEIFENQSNTTSEQLNIWRQRERRITFSIVTFIMQKNRDFLLAIKILEDLLGRQQQHLSYDVWILSILGRIHLQMGNLKTAKDIFKITDSLIDNKSKEQTILNLMNQGFFSIALDQYPKAIEYFDQILKIDSNHIAANNNKCISMLYTCDLGGSLIQLENLLQAEKEKSIDETLIFNICSLYELASDKSSEKKKSIMSNIAKKAPDNFDFKVFKISNLGTKE